MSKRTATTFSKENAAPTPVAFRSAFNRPKATPSPCGEGVYEYEYELDGETVKDKWQIYADIQSHESESLVSNLVRRYKDGDLDALNSRKGEYMDITEMPKDLQEAHKRILEARIKFDELLSKQQAQAPTDPSQAPTDPPNADIKEKADENK